MRIAYLSALIRLSRLPQFCFCAVRSRGQTNGRTARRSARRSCLGPCRRRRPAWQTLSDATILVAGYRDHGRRQGDRDPAWLSGHRLPGQTDLCRPDRRLERGRGSHGTVQVRYWNQNVTPQSNAAQAAVALPLGKQVAIARHHHSPRGALGRHRQRNQQCGLARWMPVLGRTLLRQRAWQHLQLTVPRSGPRETYPNSPMGATALLRQVDLRCKLVSRSLGRLSRQSRTAPTRDQSCAAGIVTGGARRYFVIDAPNERMAIRADAIAKEFALKLILRGSGREYRELPSIVAANRSDPASRRFSRSAQRQVGTGTRASDVAGVDALGFGSRESSEGARCGRGRSV